MGKMKLKLSHVMPHSWLYKLKVINKTGASHAPYKMSDSVKATASSSTSGTRKVTYVSPVNHKAIDIPFPTETPKRSPRAEPHPDYTAALDQLELVDCRPSVVLPSTFNIRRISDEIMEAASANSDHELNGPSSAPRGKEVVSSGLSFDVRELERRLKALGSEDRRRYYSSPLLSATMPSPIMNDGMHAYRDQLRGEQSMNVQDYSLDETRNGQKSKLLMESGELDEQSMNVQEYSLDNTGNGRKGKLLMESAELDDVTGHVDGSCRSIDEHSTSSSSDTGIERGSSSMWERDVFSITSDGSEAFTNVLDDVESNLMPLRSARHQFRKLRERMNSALDSPLHGRIHLDHGMSRFCDNRWQQGCAQHGSIHRLYEESVGEHENKRNGSYAGSADVCDTHEVRGDSYVTIGDMDDVHFRPDDARGTSYESIWDPHGGDHSRGMYVCKDVKAASYADIEDPHIMDDSRTPYVGRGNINVRSTWSSNKGNGWPWLAPTLGKCIDNEVMMHLDNHSPFNPLPSMDYQRLEDLCSESGRRPLGGFSYAQCKERLLSSRAAEVNKAMMVELAPEKMSNYAKFKLKKMGMYPDPGLYNTVSKVHACNMDSMASSSVVRSRFAPGMRPKSLRSPGPTTASHSRSAYKDQGSAGHINNRCAAEDDGHSRSTGTLKAVREKIKDPSFQQFSKASPGGTSAEVAGPESRVFDSFAMVKCSYDPKEDFKRSMVEMIVEKDLHSSHDMVELLQCYLTLNAKVYHDTIVKVFTEVWSEMFKHV